MASQRNGTSSHSLEMGNSNQELVTRPGARRWKFLGLAIAAAILLAVLATVLVIVVNKGDDKAPRGEALSLEDILARRFSPRPFNATWFSDHELFYDIAGAFGYEPVIFDIKTKQKRSPFPKKDILNPQTFQTELSADGLYALEAHGYRSLFRHSYLAFYNVIDVKTGEKTALTIPAVREPVPFQLVMWAPVGNALAMVAGFDVYYRPAATAQSLRITATGVRDTVYNGIPDWVYEEEILSSNRAMWFSPDGQRLAFASYNDTKVSLMTLPYYGRPGQLLFQYTRAVNIRYPKPGTDNPDVTLTVMDLVTRTAVLIDPPPPIKASPSQPILAVTQWVPDQPRPRLLTVWMNRVQNHAVVEMVDVDAAGAVARAQVAELREPEGWIELFEAGATSAGARGSVLLPLSHPVANDSFRHVARFDPDAVDRTKYTRTDLTDGPFVVTSILSWDSVNGYVYFVSTAPDDPARSLVQRVKDAVDGAPHTPECLSCNLTDCSFATASLSKENGHIALTCQGPDVPYTVILATGAEAPRHEVDWERNDAMRQGLTAKRLPSKKRMTVALPGGFEAQVMMWLPPGADLSGNTKYPMLVDVYAGPNSFKVSERFSVDWGTFLSANKSIIYATIDGRGSGNKGDKTIFSIYRRFGTYEVEDQIYVTRQLQTTLPYVDKSRTAIWGWSYGGYAAAMALAKDTENVFKCGMSVAPVTDWIYYDSIYTERYMGLPDEDNIAGYKAAQITNKVENLKNKLFLLIHGTLDDNVHYQQSMMLSRALEENDILFRQQSYPDEEHGIANLQTHLYHTLQNFLSECFGQV